MFIFQQKTYDLYDMTTDSTSLQDFKRIYQEEKPAVVVYDTETTGLNLMLDKPFLVGFGFNKSLFIMHPTKENLDFVYETIKDCKLLIAHNAKFDYHMLINNGTPVPPYISLGDSLTIARLTEYADVPDSIGLETLGMKYVDMNAKFAGKVIKNKINAINRARLSDIKKGLKKKFNLSAVGPVWEAYKKRVQFVDYGEEMQTMFDWIDSNYQEANYQSVYEDSPELMIHYLADDLAILLEYLKVAMPTLKAVDRDYTVFRRENELIRVVGDTERVGIRADIGYLLQSRDRVSNYRDLTYKKLHEITTIPITVGQHKEIKNIFLQKFGINLEKSDVATLKTVASAKTKPGAIRMAELIIELRSLDKWLSTYIEGMLNRVYNGRIHTSVNNAGTITGRVSSDLQQQPKAPLLDDEGNELFHPRRVFIADPGHTIVYFDYSQMELRLQAHYTVGISGGDPNLCRAFMPFQCKRSDTSEVFDYHKNKDFDKYEWLTEKGELWEPVDLHTATTLKAFPDLTIDHPEFKRYRTYGKVANFLKNYGGGVGAIMEQLGVSEGIARDLDQGYYEAFPKIREYQRWVDQELSTKGYVQNMFGRRYYIKDWSKYYKAYNYLIQGGCADLLKLKEIQVYNFLKRVGDASKMILFVHDELQISIPDDQMWLIPQIKAIMDNNGAYIDTLPMTCDVEVTTSSWADKVDYHG